MKKLTKKHKQILIGVGLLLLLVGGIFAFKSKSSPEVIEPPSKKPKKQVNLIPLEERPYVTLQPLSSRNMLQITMTEPKKPSKSVEITLEYDRNKGVLDAVINSFLLEKYPLVEQMFLGSKSAGGSITYHDDVIGGTMTLDFTNEDYALEVPWRYSDTQSSYDQLSTTDGKFQITLDKPIKQTKIIVMQSPGLPAEVESKVLAGPYFISTVGDLPVNTAQIKFRLSEDSQTATIMGWDGSDWVSYDTTLDGRAVEAEGDLVSTYVVVK